jgi:hypothetical protein
METVLWDAAVASFRYAARHALSSLFRGVGNTKYTRREQRHLCRAKISRDARVTQNKRTNRPAYLVLLVFLGPFDGARQLNET